MFRTLFSRKTRMQPAADAAPGRLDFRARYESWRFRRDLAAIMATLDRLSDRRLEMIGMHREDLFDAVSDLMLRAEEQRAIGREVVALLDAPQEAGSQKSHKDEHPRTSPKQAPVPLAKVA